jgi:hypothetical protein
MQCFQSISMPRTHWVLKALGNRHVDTRKKFWCEDNASGATMVYRGEQLLIDSNRHVTLLTVRKCAWCAIPGSRTGVQHTAMSFVFNYFDRYES